LNRNYSPRTLEIYINCLKSFFSSIPKAESDIHEDDVLDFLLNLQKKGRAPKTINLYKESIKTYFIQKTLAICAGLNIKLATYLKLSKKSLYRV